MTNNGKYDPKPHCYDPESDPVRGLGWILLYAIAMIILGIIAAVSIFLGK